MNDHPIVCMISSYKEGTLVQSTIKSAMGVALVTFVSEGLTEPEGIEGPATDLGIYRDHPLADIRYHVGVWESETAKRNSMLQEARRYFNGSDDFWILTLDADEILVWGEYLHDYVSVLNPGRKSAENIPSFKLCQPVWIPVDEWKEDKYQGRQPGWWTDTATSHLFHASLIKRYLVGAWQIETHDGLVAFLDAKPAPNLPMYGEPHIQHRPFLRRGDRATLRSSDGEEKRWLEERGLQKS
jgi:hypothetical protein